MRTSPLWAIPLTQRSDYLNHTGYDKWLSTLKGSNNIVFFHRIYFLEESKKWGKWMRTSTSRLTTMIVFI